jgi:hypothetical protein
MTAQATLEPPVAGPPAPGPRRPGSPGWAAANRRRVQQAAVFGAGNVEAALKAVGDTVPGHLLAAGRLRASHPGESLSELAARAGCSKDTLAGRLRRLLQAAGRAAAAHPAAPAVLAPAAPAARAGDQQSP